MYLRLSHDTRKCNGKLRITGSKSETNRLLLLQALFSGFVIENKSNSDDSKVMEAALNSDAKLIDIHHAGTAMRFLTAYFSQLEGREVVLTGSSRIQERPIKILVDGLRSLGAKIFYEKKDGYPPLRIKGRKLIGGSVVLPADVSSQYVSALLMLGSVLEKGIELKLLGEITSFPYIKMTLDLLHNFGVSFKLNSHNIKVNFLQSPKKNLQLVESDWSSASYFFSIVALSEEAEIHLKSYKPESLQGDAVLKSIYKDLGVNSRFVEQSLILTKEKRKLPEYIKLNLSKSPDIAQTIAVTCFGLGIGCDLEGLSTLKIKETDRLVALKNELSKLGAIISITDKSLHLSPGNDFVQDCSILTYEDHRMAMSFAPLALKTPLYIEEASVVSKSYPDFWRDLTELNFKIEER